MTNMNIDDFEAGENVTDQVTRRSKPGIVVSVRLSEEDSDSLVDLAEESGKTVSQVARQAIRSFMSQRRQPPVFVPEVTGNNRFLDIVTIAPLGARTAGGPRDTEGEQAPSVQTGYLVGVS